MRMRIRLETCGDVCEFVKICSQIEEPVFLKDGNDFCVSGKSIMGGIASLEWDELYCESTNSHLYFLLKKFAY